MLLLRPPRPDRASTAWRCPDSPRPRLPLGSGTLRPGRPGRPWRVWPGQPRACRPWGRAPAPPPPPGTTGSPSHAGTPEPAPPPRPTHQPPHAPPHHDAHPDQPQNQTQNTPPTSGASTTRPHRPESCPPNAQGVPDRERTHPHAQKVPVEIGRPALMSIQCRTVPSQHRDSVEQCQAGTRPGPDPTPGSVPDQRPSGAQAGARSTTMRSESLPTSGSRVRGASRGW